MVDFELTPPPAIEVEVSDVSESVAAALSGKAPASHTHGMNSISGLQAALLQKDELIDGAMSAHLAGEDPHPQYLKESDLTAISSQFPKTVVELPYTFSQSSALITGSYADLTDGSTATGAGTTNEGSSIAWLKADLGAVQFIEHIRVQGGSLPGWTSTSADWTNVVVEVSADNSNWMLMIPSGVCTTSDSEMSRYFMGYVKARYVRFKRAGFLALAELRIWGFEP
jgi:hypothetical protein